MSDHVLQRFDRAIQWMENHLDDDVSWKDLADQAALSEYHFNRLFKALTSLSPAQYLRRRRLTLAAQELLDTKEPVIEIAIGAGYDSQEAFSRGFKDMFGLPPAKFRSERPDLHVSQQPALSLKDLEHFSGGGLTIEPVIQKREAFSVAGMGSDFEFAQFEEINALWKAFLAKLEAEEIELAESFGICQGGLEWGHPSKIFHYTAGYETGAKGIEPLPGMEVIEIPESTYAVFTHQGHISDMSATLRYIWQIWIPNCDYELADSPDFESYETGDFDEDTLEGTIKIWIPVNVENPCKL